MGISRFFHKYAPSLAGGLFYCLYKNLRRRDVQEGLAATLPTVLTSFSCDRLLERHSFYPCPGNKDNGIFIADVFTGVLGVSGRGNKGFTSSELPSLTRL